MLAISNASSNVSQPVSRQQRPRNVPPPKLKEESQNVREIKEKKVRKRIEGNEGEEKRGRKE